MLLPLKPHQEVTVEFCLKNRYSIVALDVGLGKTCTSLAVWQKRGGNLLIVCPSYLCFNWKNEIRKFIGPEPIISHFATGDSLYFPVDTDICIISYDLVKKAEYLFEWADMVVADEANYLMKMDSQRSKIFHKAVYENAPKSLLLLTGTPIKNRVEEFFSLMALCYYRPGADGEFDRNFKDAPSFADRFSNRREYTMFVGRRRFKVIKWEGFKNVEELKRYLLPIYIRYESKDVLNLPPITYKNIEVSDTNDPALLEGFEQFAKENKSVDPAIKVESAVNKVPFTLKYAKDLIDEVGQIVIFSDHVEPARLLAEGLKCQFICGETPAHKRQELADRFQKGEIKVLIATIRSFSTGVNLTSSCNMVFNDYPWVPGDLSQAEARIHRLGQTKPCVVHRILGSPQDKYILETIEEKLHTIKGVT